jgi:hypothetical protein
MFWVCLSFKALVTKKYGSRTFSYISGTGFAKMKIFYLAEKADLHSMYKERVRVYNTGLKELSLGSER